MTNFLKIFAGLGLAVALGACSQLDTAKTAVVGFVADKGNKYCEVRDPEFRDEAIARINAELAKEGANWQLLGVSCNDAAPAE
jgi:hypothetical protein